MAAVAPAPSGPPLSAIQRNLHSHTFRSLVEAAFSDPDPCTPSCTSWRFAKPLAFVVVVIQVAWALVIPIKNVAVMAIPDFATDREETFTNSSYPGYTPHDTPRLNGIQVRQLVQDILDLSLGDDTLRRKFEEHGDFVIDELASTLSPTLHQTFTQREEAVIVPNRTTGVNTTIKIVCNDDADVVLHGMRCFDTVMNLPCDDSSFVNGVPKNTTALDFVNLSEVVGTTSGWTNSIGLITFVDFFHQIMRQIFAKQDWKAALLPYQDINLVYNPYRLLTPFTDDGLLTMPDESTLWTNDGQYLKYGKKTIVSCATSEVIFGCIYVRHYVIGLIQEALQKYGLYNYASGWIATPPYIENRTKVLFTSALSVEVTVGAGFKKFLDIKRTLFTVLMTEKSNSSVLLKRDRALQGAMLMGSSIRNVWHLCRYPNSFYSYMTPEVNNVTDALELEYRQIGALHAGFNGMKFDFTRNTMAVLKLSEQSKVETVNRTLATFALEQELANWYRDYEVRPDTGLVALVQQHFGSMDGVDGTKQVHCYQGLLRKIAQVAWIMALRLQPVMNHLVYTAMVDGGDPASWTLKQMLLSEVVAEDPYGNRVHMPYVRTSISADLGNAWPMIPLLAAFCSVRGSTFVLQELLLQMNSTYNQLIELEAGNSQLRDVVFCPIGQQSANVSAHDSKDEMYAKIYPLLVGVITDLLGRVDEIHKLMETEVVSVQVRREIVLYDRYHSIFNFEGSPVYWQNSALGIGLMRLTSKEAPFPEDLRRVQSTMVCYNTLELRYLNTSTRCWNEVSSVEEVRQKRFSEGLRVIVFSTWSMGIVLNLIGAYVAVTYTWTLWRSWVLSEKEPFSIDLALNLDIQSIGLMNMSKCCIMAFSVIPLIFSIHLPPDDEFMKTRTDMPPWWNECIVALCMTWFVRLGMEMGRYFVQLRHFNLWFYIITMRVRNCSVIFTFLLRQTIPQTAGDFDTGIAKLILSCLVSTILGFLLVFSSRFVMTDDRYSRDKLSQLLARGNFDRTWYGVLGQSPSGWSHAGLLFEGWRAVECDGGGIGLVLSRFVDLNAPERTDTVTLARPAFLSLTQGNSDLASPPSAARLNAAPSTATKTTGLRARVTSRVNADQRKSHFRRAVVAVLVVTQVFWAMIIPIKNVAVMSTPLVRDDQVETSTNSSYPGLQLGKTQEMTGQDVLALVNDILELSISNDAIRHKFEENGDFVIDDLATMLTSEQHKTFGLYYGLVLQSSEALAATFTPREEDIIIANASASGDVKITLKCPASDAQLQGMLCTDASGLPCDDSSFVDGTPKPDTKLKPVQLSSVVGDRADYAPSVCQTELAGSHIMPYQDYSVIYNPYPLTTPFSIDNVLKMPDEATFWVNDGAYLKYGKATFISCALSEIVLGYVYVRRYVIDLIQQKLKEQNWYKVNSALITSPAFILDRAKIVFSSSVSVTVGAGFSDFSEINRKLYTVLMTSKASSMVLLKRDRAMEGSMLMGSSIRHLWYMMRYPNSFYSYMTPEVRSDSVVLEYKQIGSLHSGFNGMKFDFTRNVMAVIKLSERAKLEGTGQNVNWFDQEQQFADWFFHREGSELVPLVRQQFGDLGVGAAKEVECYRGLIRKIAQVTWIMALRQHVSLNHLVYTAMLDGGDPASWTAKQMLLDELVVEDPYGYRSSISYVRTSITPNTGNAWPMIPLLVALQLFHGRNDTLRMLFDEMNGTYNNLIELEAANTQFRDVVFCPIGVNKFGVSKTDDKASMYEKIAPALKLLLADIVDAVPHIHSAMENEVAPVQVRQELLQWNRHHPIFMYEGSPVYWQNSALAVGLVRLATKEAPLPEDLERYRSSVVCYNTLELRYLNASTRCWNELRSVLETRTQRSSEGLRVISFSMWSMGVVLNVIGAHVAIIYSTRLWRSWVLSGFEDISMELAVNLDIQSIGMLNLGQCAIMAFSVLPLIVSYHIPNDIEFTQPTGYPSWFVEIIVALCMTWFVRLGMEIGRYAIRLRHFNRWFYITSTRVRYTAVVVTWVVRLSIPVKDGDFNMGIWKLIVSCVASLFLGAIMITASKLFETPDFQPRDRLSQLLLRGGFDRNWYGVLGQTTFGWSHVGLLFEGWQVVKRGNGRIGLVHSKFLDLDEASDAKTTPLDHSTFKNVVKDAKVHMQPKGSFFVRRWRRGSSDSSVTRSTKGNSRRKVEVRPSKQPKNAVAPDTSFKSE
ncbi:TPA: hypothetical protein N0F65_006956 [Lagenidium giganteum]|uniref:1,3-beta-glucan synthase n=1 Tax=Lagenidium giganteum TaxID=4803 RepID=A0AAV2ZKB8_9STRA|nr:TPA: hypothetical protein N0F65_006956 [Lagenidium giganteum]